MRALFFISVMLIQALSLPLQAAAGETPAPSAQSQAPVSADALSLPSTQSQTTAPPSFTDKVKSMFGVTYFSFFNGPGILGDTVAFSPNQYGKPENNGLYLQNNISLRYKFSERLGLDFQTRFKLIFNNYTRSP